MEAKRAYLLANARQITNQVELQGQYDENEQINVECIDGLTKPVALLPNIAHTSSKTATAPGDDDPDPEDERCY